MILLASGTTLLRRYGGSQPWLGQLIDPRGGHAVAADMYAADNAAFSRFDAPAYLAMVERIVLEPRRPLFVVVPDQVGSAEHTMALWERWSRILRPYRLPLAFVLQDGVEATGVPWRDVAAVFVGGAKQDRPKDEFKVGSVARHFVAEAKRRGKWVHMGRVSSVRRITYAQQVGCDSIDSSGFSKWSDAMLPRFSRVRDNGELFKEAGA